MDVRVKNVLLGCVVDAFGVLIDHVKCTLGTSYKTKMWQILKGVVNNCLWVATIEYHAWLQWGKCSQITKDLKGN